MALRGLKNQAALPRWPAHLGTFPGFLYAPERWARAHGLRWSPRLEDLRAVAVRWLLRHAGAPYRPPSGRLIRRDTRRPLSPKAPQTARLAAARSMPWQLSAIIARMRRGEGPREILLGQRRVARQSVWGDRLSGSASREEERALLSIIGQCEAADRHPWLICPICGRPFPVHRNTKACPPCRRRWTPRQIQWRLATAPEHPVWFRDAVREDHSPFRQVLVIDPHVKAPAALRRLACSSPRSRPHRRSGRTTRDPSAPRVLRGHSEWSRVSAWPITMGVFGPFTQTFSAVNRAPLPPPSGTA
jgi:hypothetical protein